MRYEPLKVAQTCMNLHRSKREMISGSQQTGLEKESNVTQRRGAKDKKSKMALPSIIAPDHDKASLFIDSILSQAETEEVAKMLELENEDAKDILRYSGGQEGFFTSTQMIRDKHQATSSPLLMSPIMHPGFQNPMC